MLASSERHCIFPRPAQRKALTTKRAKKDNKEEEKGKEEVFRRLWSLSCISRGEESGIEFISGGSLQKEEVFHIRNGFNSTSSSLKEILKDI